MRRLAFCLSCVVASSAASIASAVTISPLSSFGGGDGWLAPGEGGYTFLGTANNERGLAYGNGHVYLVSRTGGNFVRILDPLTGADLGGLNVTGVTGGTFALNAAATGSDGAIYVGNLTTQSTTSPFKVYRWATEASAPTVAYTGDAGLAGARVGDSLAMTGANRLAAGYGSSPVVAGNNGYSIVDVATATASAVSFGTPPNGGDFRLGITFTDSSHVIGDQGITGVLYRYTSFSGTSGTLIASPANSSSNPNNTAERLMAYAVVQGIPLLAMQSIGDSHVSIYDVSNPATPIYLTSGNNTSGTLVANGNGTGQLAWNYSGSGDTATLYAMSTNQGIQAFTVVIPEPATLAGITLALGALCIRRRRGD